MKLEKQLSIGQNRGKARLWIEGIALTALGWNKGTRFDCVHNESTNQIWIFRKSDGKRKVAGTCDRPIIDTNTDKILSTLGCDIGDKVHLMIATSCIQIRKTTLADDKANTLKNVHRTV